METEIIKKYLNDRIKQISRRRSGTEKEKVNKKKLNTG